MRFTGFLAATLMLLLLGAAPAANDRANAPPLPGFPQIKFNAALLEEPRDENGKSLLKLVTVYYNEEFRVIVFLLELQTDIGFDEKLSIDKAWNYIGSNSGPSAFFFDRENVARTSLTFRTEGKLYEGKKGDRIRMLLLPGKEGFPAAVYMDVRRTTELAR
jgi:hypothetical protein